MQSGLCGDFGFVQHFVCTWRGRGYLQLNGGDMSYSLNFMKGGYRGDFI